MREAVAVAGTQNQSRIISLARTKAPTLIECSVAVLSALLLVLSFPNFDLNFFAWFALVPLLLVVAGRPSTLRGFVLGWITGTIFFYSSCYWLTYSMIHYGELNPLLSYILLLPPTLLVGLFPALAIASVSLSIKRWGHKGVLLLPVFWSTLEWARLGISGQLWNALGYSQAQVAGGLLIQSARWGGVYIVGFLILAVNAALAFVLLRSTARAILVGASIVIVVVLIIVLAAASGRKQSQSATDLSVVAVQPNVPMVAVKTLDELKELAERHVLLSTNGLKNSQSNLPRLVIWPESPMNFTYAGNKEFQDFVSTFTRENHTSLIFNSLEPAPNDGGYNSALLVNEQGQLIAQYDKIRLMPFGEYVPLPQWLGGSLISGIVGDFTPGSKYTLMPVGDHRAGVFICIESAYPSIARRLTQEGADVLINISNDGYLGPTAVMKQHLANTIFRAVENGRPLLRVTNTGLSARIDARGSILDETSGFQADVRSWQLKNSSLPETFYTRHGDLFAQLCTVLTILTIAVVFLTRRRSFTDVR